MSPETPEAAANVRRGWIISPGYDLILLTLSPIAGVLLIWATNLPLGAAISGAALYLVAIPHYLSSFTFYLGDENLAYYRTRWAAFFGGPLIIVLLYAVVFVSGHVRIIQSTMFVWNIYHVALQSAGILSVYRRLNGGGVTGERNAAHLAILSVNATMAFWYVERFPPLYELLIAVHPLAPSLLAGACLTVGATSLGVFLNRLRQRIRPVAPPEVAFLLTSLALFHPYLWVADSNVATFAMLMGHFIQYLTIVWMVNRRKFAGATGSWRQRVLGRVSARPPLLFAAICGAGILFYSFNHLTAFVGVPGVYLIAWNLLTLLHFYTDGLVWAFKRPYVQQTVGPYVAPDSHVVRD